MAASVTPNAHRIVDRVAYVDVSTKTHPQIVAIVDPDDLPRVLDGRGHWYAFRKPGSALLYVRRDVNVAFCDRRHQQLHRVLCSPIGDDLLVIHRDHNGLNNGRANLAVVSRQQSGAHAQHSKGKRRGITRRGDTGRWRAVICVSGKMIQLGNFDTEAEAARAYDKAAREHYGDFARLNFPGEPNA